MPLLLSRSASARSQFLDPITVTALFPGQAVGFPPSARWRESLQLAVVVEITDGAEAYSALTHFSYIRKRKQNTCLPTGSAFAASRHAGVSRQELRSLPWNGGRLGQRHRARLATRTQTNAPDICDVVVWKATAAFYVSRWYGVSLASPEPYGTTDEGDDTVAKWKSGSALWYGSTSHLGTVATRTHVLC